MQVSGKYSIHMLLCFLSIHPWLELDIPKSFRQIDLLWANDIKIVTNLEADILGVTFEPTFFDPNQFP